MLAVVAMCKDELDVVDGFVEWMASQADVLVISDNGSTDGTRERLDELARDFPLTVLDDPEVGYFQSRKVTALAALAAERGADIVIPADMDERWYSPFGRIADVLADFPQAAIFTAALYDHVASALDPDESDPVKRIGWRRREAAPLQKVACRPLAPVTIHQGNHSASYENTQDNLLVVRHYALRSPEQMVRKARNGGAAYAATTLPKEVGAHWRGWSQLSDEQLGEVFRRYYWAADPAGDPSLIYDPAPIGAACNSASS